MQWLPLPQNATDSELGDLPGGSITEEQKTTIYSPAVAAFGESIKADSELYTLLCQSFEQAPKSPYVERIENFEQMLDRIHEIIIRPPSYNVTRDAHGKDVGVPIGVPFIQMLELLALSPAGYELFCRRSFNDALGHLFNAWGAFLTTKASTSSLHDGDDGWFGKYGLASLAEKNRGIFEETYVCPDPTAVDRGFPSWDAFFTREVQLHARPFPESDDPSLIYMACESTVYAIVHGVQKQSEVILKGRPYSLYEMLDSNSADADMFAGGMVFQGFLTPQDYHRWNSPVTGVVTKTVVVRGTYYAMAPGIDGYDRDYTLGLAIVESQGWMSLSAARALIFIKSDNPDIGTVCFIGVGMCEVSTAEITVKEGQRVRAGQEIGMFHYGGSSHAVLFGPQTNITFEKDVCIGNHRHVRSVLGRACS